MNNKKIVIVMPAYNAEKTLLKTYNDIPITLRKKENIILVDDNSRDKTLKLANKLGLKVIKHNNNKGYGGNQKTCYTQALKEGADIVVMLHPDYQYDSSMINELIRPLLDGWLDIMLGNRIRTRKETLNGGMPQYKYYSNRFLTMVENIILGLNLGEYHTGFRAYTRKALNTVAYNNFSDDFVFDQEMIIAASYKGLKLGEIAIPVRYFDEASSINFYRSVKYGTLTLVCLGKYLLEKFGVYKFRIFS